MPSPLKKDELAKDSPVCSDWGNDPGVGNIFILIFFQFARSLFLANQSKVQSGAITTIIPVLRACLFVTDGQSEACLRQPG